MTDIVTSTAPVPTTVILSVASITNFEPLKTASVSFAGIAVPVNISTVSLASSLAFVLPLVSEVRVTVVVIAEPVVLPI